MVNMLIRKENLQMDEAKVKLIACMNWIEIDASPIKIIPVGSNLYRN